MITIIFIILKVTHIIHISWWWIILTILIDEESQLKILRRNRKNKAEDIYEDLEEEYKDNFSEDDVEELLE